MSRPMTSVVVFVVVPINENDDKIAAQASSKSCVSDLGPQLSFVADPHLEFHQTKTRFLFLMSRINVYLKIPMNFWIIRSWK